MRKKWPKNPKCPVRKELLVTAGKKNKTFHMNRQSNMSFLNQLLVVNWLN